MQLPTSTLSISGYQYKDSFSSEDNLLLEDLFDLELGSVGLIVGRISAPLRGVGDCVTVGLELLDEDGGLVEGVSAPLRGVGDCVTVGLALLDEEGDGGLVGGVSPPVLGVGFFVVALESLADLEVVGFSLFEEYVGGFVGGVSPPLLGVGDEEMVGL
jgi:hypothetical protein